MRITIFPRIDAGARAWRGCDSPYGYGYSEVSRRCEGRNDRAQAAAAFFNGLLGFRVATMNPRNELAVLALKDARADAAQSSGTTGV